MEYKYEPIFGDQSLFDGAPEDAEYAGWFCQETRWYMILNGKILFSDGGVWSTSDSPYLSSDIAAMRRIIPQPKRWTRAEKDAERQPEVGEWIADPKGHECEFVGCDLYSGDDDKYHMWHVRYSTSLCASFPSDKCKPIETPAEKAQRERDEWIDNACSFICFYDIGRVDAIKSLEITYDKLKSGELPMPVKGGE